MSLQYAILGLLSYKSMTGYNLKKMFDESINYFWSAHLSQIYRELGILEDKQYVTSQIEQQTERPDKKVYTITAAGKEAFDDWVRNFPQKTSKITRDEFVVRIFFGSKLSKAELINQFEQYIETKKNEKRTIIKEVDRNINQYSIEFASDRERLYWGFIEKRAQMTNAVVIKWAKECIKELKNSDLP